MTKPPNAGRRKASERMPSSGASLEQVFQDVRFGLRLLRREPGFAATTVLTLTLAIGATTTIFSVVDAVLLQPPPFPEPDRLVTLWQTDPNNGNRPAEPAPANFLDWREQATSFEQVAAIEPFSFDFTGDSAPEVFYASLVTEGFFDALGVAAAYGRTFLPEEFRPGSGVVVLTHGFWERRFGGDTGILGRSLTLDGQPHTVVGILAPDFELGLERGRGRRDIYVPKAIAEYETFIRSSGWWHVIARVRPEVTLAAAQAELDAIAARLAADYPRTNTDVGARVVPLHTQQVEAVRPALVLLVGAGLLLQSFTRLVHVDLGFAPGNTVALQVFAWDRQADDDARVNFFRETLQNIRALPGVAAAGAVSSFPLGLADITIETPLTMHDRPPPPLGEEPSTAISQVTPGYFDTMRIPLRAGRRFDERDDAERPGVAVINETLARRHWPDSEPLTERLTVQVWGQAFDAEVVGVVGATRAQGFDSSRRPEVFIPHAQGNASGEMTYVVRTAGDPAASVAAIQGAVRAVDPLQTFYSVATVDQLLSDTLAARRFTTTLLVAFALAALTLAGLGIYGVIAVATAQRTREIGLRLAMGARPLDVVRMVVVGALVLAGSGVVFGAVAAVWTSQFLTSLLFGIAPTDVATLAGVAMLLLLVGASAAWLPARRAARVDPLVALRTE